jgi:type II secretory pathway pseudopilin PulG
MYRNTHTQEEGIILVEAIIAIGVLVIIFTATIALYVSSIQGVRTSNDKLVATFLAQDAMEYVMAKRQYNFEEIEPYLTGISHCTVAAPCNPQVGDTMSSNISSCGGACTLYLDPATKRYGRSGGAYTQQTIFSRSVTVDEFDPGQEAKVTVTVSWQEKGHTNTLPLIFNLYADPNL